MAAEKELDPWKLVMNHLPNETGDFQAVQHKIPSTQRSLPEVSAYLTLENQIPLSKEEASEGSWHQVGAFKKHGFHFVWVVNVSSTGWRMSFLHQQARQGPGRYHKLNDSSYTVLGSKHKNKMRSIVQSQKQNVTPKLCCVVLSFCSILCLVLSFV